MMKSMISTVNPSSQDRFGRHLAARLDAATKDLPHDISERLRVARLQALDKYREVLVREGAPVHLGSGIAAITPQDFENAWWPRMVALLPLIALIAGLIAIQVFGADQMAKDLAELDVAILTDDLPPDAYADPGFAQFLKSRIDKLQ